jgi:hypothetical protein
MKDYGLRIEKGVTVPRKMIRGEFGPIYSIMDKMDYGDSVAIDMTVIPILKERPRRKAAVALTACLYAHAEWNGYIVRVRVEGWKLRFWKLEDKEARG